MAAEQAASAVRRNSNTQLLEELEALSQSLYQAHSSSPAATAGGARRTASLALPRTSLAPIISSDEATNQRDKIINPKPRYRRMSLSPFRSRPKLDDGDAVQAQNQNASSSASFSAPAPEKKGGRLWNWKPIRALTHIGMQKLSCLFSVEVVTVQGLPASMNGLRLSVCVRRKETKDGAVQTMPSRVSQGAADFEETLFLRCHVYCSPPSSSRQQQLKLEPRPFLVYVFAVDAPELDFGRNYVDLSLLIQESVEKSSQGTRVRQWDTSFNLAGKAKGGEVVLKLGFQLMEKDGAGGGLLYNNTAGNTNSSKSKSFGRRQSKSSFSIPSPRMSARSAGAWTPSQSSGGAPDLPAIDDLDLDEEPAETHKSPPPPQPEANKTVEDVDLLDFDVVDKGVEFQDSAGDYLGQSDGDNSNSDKRSVSSGHEVVKEIVHDKIHLTRLTELDSIAQQIKALESMMRDVEKPAKLEQETETQRLDAEEETITREFLHMLEDEEQEQEANDYFIKFKQQQQQQQPPTLQEAEESESRGFLADLGKGLGCVVQTKDGGYLASMNPLNTLVSRKDTPKLAMQTSKPLVLALDKEEATRGGIGFELFQRMAALGWEELGSEIVSKMPLDELMGKTAEQIAFEGIASAIIHGRNKEGASSSAARTIAAVKSMAARMSGGRKERISTGIWNVSEEAVGVDEILALSMQKIEDMAVEGLKIQAEMAEEEAPFAVRAVTDSAKTNNPLASAIALEDWMKKNIDQEQSITIALLVQLRDPLRRYEAVGGPAVVLINATTVECGEERKFKVASMHVGGLKIGRGGGGKRNFAWDTEKQRLTAMQWLVAYGLGKAAPGKKGRPAANSKGPDLLWSISSRVMADTWLKPMRNPDFKFSS